MFHIIRRWFRLEVAFFPLRPRKRRKQRRLALAGSLQRLQFQPLESREMLYGYINAANDGQYAPYQVVNTSSLTVAAPGVLANDTGGTPPLTPHVGSQPAHGTVTLASDGGFIYTPVAGYTGPDSWTYFDTDSQNDYSSTATVYLNVEPGMLSDVDQTKLPADTLTVPMQILGDSSGQPGTANNLSLVYHSSTAQPTQTLEQDWQPSLSPMQSVMLDVGGSFNGTQQNATYVNTGDLSGSNPTIRLSVDVSTAALATGRYADSQTVSIMTSQGNALISTLNGAANVVNDQASPLGAGWEMPGIYHIYQNSASGVAPGVLLTTGDGNGWYFTQAGGSSYTSPNGPEAFSTLVGLSGGGWQLTNQYGTVYTFNSSGYLTSTELCTTAATTYGWSGNDLTSITDPFGRSVHLAYSGNLLSTITNFAGSVWTIGHSGTALVSITEPNPGNGSPVWTMGYSGSLLTSVNDPNQNASSYAFNTYSNLSGDTLPGGAGESYDSEQNYGYGGPTQSSASNAVLAANVFNSTTDPNGNTSKFQTDRFNNVTTYVDPYGAVSTYLRDQNGLLTQLTQPPPAPGDAAPVTTYTHDSLGNQTSATGANPSYGTSVFNSFSELTSFTDSLHNTWTRSYSPTGALLSETDPENNTVSFTVDTLGSPLTITRPAPNNAAGTVTTTLTRDQYERLTKITWPDSATETFAYNTIDLPTSITDEDNHTSQTAYNVLGQITTVTAADGGFTSFTRDSDGNILTTQDALGNITTNVWNGRNELTQQTLPAPVTGGTAPILAWSYDANGNELSYTDGLGRVTSETWDKLNRLSSESLPPQSGSGSGPTTDFGYDALSRKVSETNALSGTTTWAYANTDVSQVTSMILPAPSGSGSGPATNYFYDADGRQNQVENALGQYTTTTFTSDGQTASVKDNLGDTTTYAYGQGQELLSTTDPLNHTTNDQYDSRYRLVETSDANGGVTQITLDPAGNRVKLVDSDNNETDWTYSPTNLPLTETNALGTTTTTYNLDQEVTSIKDADGRVRDFAYDNDQRLTAENWMQGSTIVASMNYGYDLANELTSASDANSAYAFAYSGDGQSTTVDNNGTPGVPRVVLTSGYDLLGDRTSLSATIAGAADFANTYTYDADQNLTMVQQQGVNGGDVVAPKEIDYGYNAIGQFTTVADYNFIGVGPRTDVLTGAYSYDNGDRLTGIAYTSNAGGTTIDALGWGYDAASNVTSFSSIDGTASYGYDPTNQLTSATYVTADGGHQPANESFSFDANGNRTMAGYSTGSDNLLTSDGTFNYQHDADGNTTVRTRISNAYATDYRTTYAWDYRNRLTDVEYYDNNPGAPGLTKHVHYVYDVFDNLIGEQDDDTGGGSYDHQEFYVVGAFPQTPAADRPPAEAVQPLLEFNAAGALIERFLVAPNPAGRYAVLAQGAVSSPSQADVVTWMADDNEGTPRDEVDNSGALAKHSVFSAFGEDVYDSNPSVAHWDSFAGGHLSAATGFENEDERWLDLPNGDWFSQDPSGLAAGDSNLTRYVNNNPANATDLTGLWAQYQITSIVTAGTYYNSAGLGHYWCVSWSDGTNAVGSDFAPRTSFASAPSGSSITYTRYVAVNPVASQPAAAPPTSVYSLMLDVDPTLAARIHEAQEQIAGLARTSVLFTATAPLAAIPMNYNQACAQAAKLGMKLEQLQHEAQLTRSTTKQINLAAAITKIMKQIDDAQKWIKFFQPTP